jgi:hypothetical protein
MLPRIAPSALLARNVVLTPITIVLLCAPTQHLCTTLDNELTEPAAQLAISRSQCAVRMVDASDPGDETLRQRVGASKDAFVLVFKGDMATRAAEHPAAEFIKPGAATALLGRYKCQPAADSSGRADDTAQRDRQRAGAPVTLDRAGVVREFSEQPLLLVLFHDGSGGDVAVIANFTAAAEELAAQRVAARLALVPLADDATRAWATSQFAVGALPSLKIMLHRKPYEYEATADVDDIVDVVRWNAGRIKNHLPSSRIIQFEGRADFEHAREGFPFVVMHFSRQWCTACLEQA